MAQQLKLANGWKVLFNIKVIKKKQWQAIQKKIVSTYTTDPS
jgi:hypothetical protein